MIGIKKVQVVPLDENYAKIIDSFNTTDDKTKNAPSINAVEGKLAEVNSDISDINDDITRIDDVVSDISISLNTLNNNAVVNGDFAVLTGTITLPEANASSSEGSVTLNYPSGFTMNNSIVIGLMANRSGHAYATPLPLDRSSSQTFGVGDLYCVLGEQNIIVRTSKTLTSQASYTTTVKVLLYKYS